MERYRFQFTHEPLDPAIEIAQRELHFHEVARAAGVKLTAQRLAIFRSVASNATHPTAEAIYRAVVDEMPMVSRDTVYRTLTLLNDLGVVHALSPRHESVRFDANTAPHHHFVCTECGLIRDVDAATVPLPALPSALNGLGAITNTYLELRGVCQDCLAEPESPPSSP